MFESLKTFSPQGGPDSHVQAALPLQRLLRVLLAGPGVRYRGNPSGESGGEGVLPAAGAQHGQADQQHRVQGRPHGADDVVSFFVCFI